MLGIVLFVGCFIAAFASIRTILRSDAPTSDCWLTLAAAMGLTSYATLSSFDFPLERITHQTSFTLLLAVVTVLKHAVQPAAGGFPAPGTARLGRLVFVPLVMVALGLGIAYSLAAAGKEGHTIRARVRDVVSLDVSIDIGKRFQTMAGFGASDAWYAHYVGLFWPPAQREAIAQLLFNRTGGIGLSMWRYNIGSGSEGE